MHDSNPDVLSIQGHEQESGIPDIDTGERSGIDRLLNVINADVDRVYNGRRCTVVARFAGIVVAEFTDGNAPRRKVFIVGSYDFLPILEEA